MLLMASVPRTTCHLSGTQSSAIVFAPSVVTTPRHPRSNSYLSAATLVPTRICRPSPSFQLVSVDRHPRSNSCLSAVTPMPLSYLLSIHDPSVSPVHLVSVGHHIHTPFVVHYIPPTYPPSTRLHCLSSPHSFMLPCRTLPLHNPHLPSMSSPLAPPCHLLYIYTLS